MKLFSKDCDSRKRMMLLFLGAALILEFLFITLENQFSGLTYYLTEDYLIVPALLFLGVALAGQLPKFAKQRLLLAGAAIAWFVLIQIIHKLSGMDTHPIATVFFVYLMAFPFASVSEDRENIGIRWIGGMFLTASLVLVSYAGLMVLDLVPSIWAEYLYWDGARLHVFWHPNMSACFFMLGIGFAIIFLVQARKPLAKVLLAVAVAVQFAAMAMTNCRTTLLLTGAFFGGILFFVIFKGCWKRFVLGLLVAALTLVGSYKVSSAIYQANNDRLVANILAAEAENSESISEAAEVEEAKIVVHQAIEGDTVLRGENGQGTLANDMRTLNGRTYIWKGAFSAIRDSKALALFGTEYSGTVISVYSPLQVVHGHNAWVESLMRMGLPGLMLSLVFTALAMVSAAKLVLNPVVELWKKILAILTMCLMATGFLEPYLFITNVYYHVTDWAFFILTGYLDYWANADK